MLTPQLLGSQIREAREARALTQAQLAQLADMPQSQISRIEAGRIDDPSFFTIGAIAEALELPVQALFGASLPAASPIVKRLYPLMPHLSRDPRADHLIGLGRIYGMHGSPDVCMRSEALAGHMLITGRTGAGKSVLLARMACDAVAAGDCVVFVDRHGAAAQEVADRICAELPERADKLISLRLGRARINLLDVPGAGASLATGALSSLLALDRAMMPGVMNAAHAAFTIMARANEAGGHAGERLSIADLPRFLQDDAWRQQLVEAHAQPPELEFFGFGFGSGAGTSTSTDERPGEYERIGERKRANLIAPVVNTIEQALMGEVGQALLTTREDRVPIERWVLDGCSIMLDASRWYQGGRVQGALVDVFARVLLDRVVATQAAIAYDGRGFTCGLRIFLDEAHALLQADTRLMEMLPEGKNADLGLVAATQDPRQFEPAVLALLQRHAQSHVTFVLDGPGEAGRDTDIDRGQRALEAMDIVRLPGRLAYANVASIDHKSAGHSPGQSKMGGSERTGPFTLAPVAPPQLDKDQVAAGRAALEERMKGLHA
jgi:transcriptional regulator with XRE-family HTH domain